jgi:hypothetical protein
MNKLLFRLVALIALLSSIAAQAMPLTGHYKPKWTQLPDMIDANDTLSMHRSNGPVVADDFVSDGRVIAGFHWWGSYFQDSGQGSERDVVFEISFHEDCPLGDPTCNNGGPYPYSTPSQNPSYFSDILTVEEDFYETTADGVDIYEYWALVDPNNGPGFLNGTWWENAGETYWLDVAWAAGQFGTNQSDAVWGWARADNGGVCILDCAVTTAAGVVGNPHIGPWTELAGEDKAFEVITVPEPGVLALFSLGLAGLGWSRRKKA